MPGRATNFAPGIAAALARPPSSRTIGSSSPRSTSVGTRTSAKALLQPRALCPAIIHEIRAVADRGRSPRGEVAQRSADHRQQHPPLGQHPWRHLREALANSVEGTRVDRGKLDEYVGRSLMLVAALSPDIDYDKASAIAHKAVGG